ncbi:hypothetical protein L249_0008 [Ophiocordyceps polyrhachis-furcata BCC 54312]|uniref:Uncharacterized protein n=1 Tax=Ophiocordyceps polyrhachis-furcata BCC 54312 TaxID=1330021 RepID=A0A367LCX2_9HYPO|nr:hypothetical protein L249_0008 [Ophiocordyceps polyrhachis-furcata BCC 54312]
MSNWRELGEVPDSEEDSQDGREVETDPPIVAVITATDALGTDLWAVPDSPLDGNEVLSPMPPPVTDPPISSPLSSAPSDQSLLSARRLLGYDAVTHSGSTEVIEEARQATKRQPGFAVIIPSRREHESAAAGSQSTESKANRGDYDVHEVETPHQRALRPRKPIQEHPYLLENARYSNTLREHGVKPLKAVIEVETRPAQRKNSTLGDEHKSQDSIQHDTLDTNQSDASQDSARDTLDVGFRSSLLRTSPSSDLHRVTSPASSQNETDNTSVADQDLPALDELLNRHPRLHLQKVKAKRQVASSSSVTARKRLRLQLHDSDLMEPDELSLGDTKPAGPPNPSTSQAQDCLGHFEVATPTSGRIPSVVPSKRLCIDIVSPLPSQSQPDEVIGISSGGEGEEEQASASAGSHGLQSDSENDSDVVNMLGQRIRGVLPASWLRLDQQLGRERAEKVSTRQRSRLVERESRRGIAKPRQASPKKANLSLLLGDSSDESEGPGPSKGKDVQQASILPGLGIRPSQRPSVRNPAATDDEESAVEDDHVDPMLPRKPRKLRQLRLPRSIRGHQWPISSSTEPVRLHRKPPKRRKISNESRCDGSPSLTRGSGPRNKLSGRVAHKSQQRPRGDQAGRQTQLMLSPPALSILDVVEPNAPRFLKIAARNVKKQAGKGRSSPGKKIIQLATRKDHTDAMYVLQDWKAGKIPQRPSVKAAEKRNRKRRREAPPAIAAGNKAASSIRTARTSDNIKNFGSGKFQARRIRSLVAQRYSDHGARNDVLPSHPRTAARPASLEVDERSQTKNAAFHARKKVLDSLHRRGQFDIAAWSFEANGAGDVDTPSKPIQPMTTLFSPPPPRKAPQRKRARPRHIDVEAPQYRHANDPLPPMVLLPEAEQDPVKHPDGKLLGLGPYGTDYTHHFEIFPFDFQVYFHETTLIGSGIIEACCSGSHQEAMADYPCTGFNMNGLSLQWGLFDARISSEMGITLDLIAEQIECIAEGKNSSGSSTHVAAATFFLNYCRHSMNSSEEGQSASLATRMIECLLSFDERIRSRDQQITRVPEGCDLALKIYDRLLLAALVVSKSCHGLPALMAEQVRSEECLKRLAQTTLSILFTMGTSRIRELYEHLSEPRYRERGLRDDAVAMHSWVTVMKVLDTAKIPRASFWDLAEAEIVPPRLLSGFDARDHEKSWQALFSLLPLTEFNNLGILTRGRRHHPASDGWIIPQKLMRRVGDIYRENSRQAPSFNNYWRALISRCHHLVKYWGWRRCVTVAGVIFDSFATQKLSDLRNEEIYESPQFLEELHLRPSLDIEPDDGCFHIFLKLIAVSIEKLKQIGASRDISNLVTRITPNHDRQHLKEQEFHARDLAALRNHLDLLSTLFWASPPELRPPVRLMERLVIPKSSHKEACLVSVRCWQRLSRFVVASGEASMASTSFEPFRGWRDAFFQQMLQQFDSVAWDVQQQLLLLNKTASRTISDALVQTTISTNRAAVMEVLHACAAASLDVMKQTPNLEAALTALNTAQLQSIFKHFSASAPQLNWQTLHASLSSLETFLDRVDEVKRDEESQGSDNFISDSVLIIDADIAEGFFSMARCVLSSPGNAASATARSVKASCSELIATLSARIGVDYINAETWRMKDMLRAGKHGLFDGPPHQLNLDQRRMLSLFVSELLKYGLNDAAAADVSLLELWTLSLVKPVEFCRYEIQFAQELVRRGKTFVSSATEELTTQPDYGVNKRLFEFTITTMRQAIRDAGHSSQKQRLLTENSATLRRVMEQIKHDLGTLSSHEAPSHDGYVSFVQDIISIIKSSELCAVDGFFLQFSKDYSPSLRDPELRLAGLIGYGLRLEEGDSRSGQQLFFLLFNNAKFAVGNDKFREEVTMLQHGMGNAGILDFVLGRILPAVVRCCFKYSAAFPLLDVYAEALRRALSEKTVFRELDDGSLAHINRLVGAAVEGMVMMSQNNGPLSEPQLHVMRQTVAVLNLFWPTLYTSVLLRRELTESLNCLRDFAVALQIDDGKVRIPAATSPSWLAFGADVDMFTDTMLRDVKKNWAYTAQNKLSIQLPRGVISTVSPGWNARRVSEDLRGRLKEWLWWWDRMHGRASSSELFILCLLCLPVTHRLPSYDTAMASGFRLPDEAAVQTVLQSFPGREQQTRALACLVHPDAAPCHNLVLHGTEATGKSAVAQQLLSSLASQDDGLAYAMVNADQCVSGRHLFETIVGAVAAALDRHDYDRCETLAQLAVALTTMVGDAAKESGGQGRWRFVLVLDAIDRQRDAPPTLVPALARLPEILPCLSCIFIVTAPPTGLVRTQATAHLHFPPYTKSEFVRILTLKPPPPPVAGASAEETTALWTRFCAAVHDALVQPACRSLVSFRRGCLALWPRFVAPVVSGTHSVKDFSKLLVAARPHFQDESLLNPSLVSSKNNNPVTLAAADMVGLLPLAARLLLLCAYLASHNAPRHDLSLFSTYHHGRKRRRGGGTVSRGTPRAKHRKIARKLLGARAFVLERMLAIFEAVRVEWSPDGCSVGPAGLDGDVGMALATLTSLRLLVRVGSGDVTDRAGKWRINASWEAVRGIGRSIGVELEDWLME